MGDAGAPIVENQWNQPVEFKGPEPWLRLEFRGQGSEYFRVWIVNVLLSVVTLGIYSAWATVRNRRYFCGNTFLDDSHFDFHGDPRAILVGRVIAIFLLAGYAGGGYLHPAAPAVTLLLIAVMMPWLIVRSCASAIAIPATAICASISSATHGKLMGFSERISSSRCSPWRFRLVWAG